MKLEDKQLSLLRSVNRFAKTQRYHGMMPRWVVKTCNEQDIRAIFELGLVAYTSVRPSGDLEIQGMVLTDKGIQCLAGN